MDLAEAGQAGGRASLNLIQQAWRRKTKKLHTNHASEMCCWKAAVFVQQALGFLVPLLTELGGLEFRTVNVPNHSMHHARQGSRWQVFCDD